MVLIFLDLTLFLTEKVLWPSGKVHAFFLVVIWSSVLVFSAVFYAMAYDDNE